VPCFLWWHAKVEWSGGYYCCVIHAENKHSTANETSLGKDIRNSLIQDEYDAGLENFQQKSLSNSKNVSEFCVLWKFKKITNKKPVDTEEWGVPQSIKTNVDYATSVRNASPENVVTRWVGVGDVTYLIFNTGEFDGLVVFVMGEVTWKDSHSAWNRGEFGCNYCLNKCVTDKRELPTRRPRPIDLPMIYREKHYFGHQVFNNNQFHHHKCWVAVIWGSPNFLQQRATGRIL
jgi:hypothetical protein